MGVRGVCTDPLVCAVHLRSGRRSPGRRRVGLGLEFREAGASAIGRRTVRLDRQVAFELEAAHRLDARRQAGAACGQQREQGGGVSEIQEGNQIIYF